MSKSKNNKFNTRYRDEDEDEGYQKSDIFKNKHREKKLTSALRSKNIDQLIDLEDEDNY